MENQPRKIPINIPKPAEGSFEELLLEFYTMPRDLPTLSQFKYSLIFGAVILQASGTLQKIIDNNS